jgi:hypothetical protein
MPSLGLGYIAQAAVLLAFAHARVLRSDTATSALGYRRYRIDSPRRRPVTSGRAFSAKEWWVMRTWTQKVSCSAWTALILLTTFAWSDSVQLRDGRHFDGKYVGGTESVVAFFTQGSIQYFPVHDILLVVFGEGPNQSVGPLGDAQALPKLPMSAPAPTPSQAQLQTSAARSFIPGNECTKEDSEGSQSQDSYWLSSLVASH